MRREGGREGGKGRWSEGGKDDGKEGIRKMGEAEREGGREGGIE